MKTRRNSLEYHIIQWNIRWYVNNYNELLLVRYKYKLNITALQETHINNNNK